MNKQFLNGGKSVQAIIKGKWFILIGWIIALAVLLSTAPNMMDLVREKGQFKLPDGSLSKTAADLSLQKSKDENHQIALVFYKNKKITSEDEDSMRKAVANIEKKKEELGITKILHYFDNSKLKSEMLSKDEKTVLVSLSFRDKGLSVDAVKKGLDKALQGVKVKYYYTGAWVITDDVLKSSEEGLKKTEGITIIFILVVLILVFRSIVAPFIPLITVGLSYLGSQSIVAFLIDWIDFPLSTFTQIFLVVVLFGIGTDYCILLLSRYKEELTTSDHVADAIVKTYKTAGKTVLYSGIAVMIGFATIGFSQFKLYQSALAVAVGVAILLIALFTIVPFFMAVLNQKLFWPQKGSLEHKESKMWEFFGRLSLKRPFLTIVFLSVCIAPFLFFYDGKLSFNDMDEIGEKYDSVKGFQIISDSFSPGKVLSSTIVLKNDEPMDNEKYLPLFEKVSREVSKVSGVDYLRSATRPVGEEISELYVKNQVKIVDEGLQKGNEGIQKVAGGLKDASTSILNSKPKVEEAASGVTDLINGTEKLKGGIGELNTNLNLLEQGMTKGVKGTGDVKNGVVEIKKNAEKLLEGSQLLHENYKRVEEGLSILASKYEEVGAQFGKFSGTLQGADQKFAEVESRYSQLSQDQQFQIARKMIQESNKGAGQLTAGMQALNKELNKATAGVKEANAALGKVKEGQQQLTNGLEKVISSLGELERGMNQVTDGQKKIIQQLPQFSTGLEKLKDGQKQIQSGFSSFSGQLQDLSSGLKEGVNGLNQVSGGIQNAGEYFTALSQAPDNQMAGWFIPNEVLKSNDFQEVFETYMSPDKKTVTFDVIFKYNPYSLDAMNQIVEIESAVKRAVKDSPLENAKLGIGGVSSSQADLRNISNEDYNRTVLLMLAGVGFILLILLRSIIMPLYLILSLVITYYTSMAVSEVVFVHLLGYSGINWVVPFFSFVILVALGVDYSIFLMSRFNEHRDMKPEEAIVLAMKKMGTVIVSAAIILGGTFAAMIPSGVLSLLQIATIVLTGLMLYALLFLPLFVPVMVKVFGEANWWPFKNDK